MRTRGPAVRGAREGAPRAGGAGAQLDRAVAVLDGVGEQVPACLGKPGPVTAHDETVGAAHVDPGAVLTRDGIPRERRVGEQARDLDPFVLVARAAARTCRIEVVE